MKLRDLSAERVGAIAQFGGRQGIGVFGRPHHEIGDADPKCKKLIRFLRHELAGRQTRSMQCRPQVVPGVAKMVAGGAGLATWIDANEQESKVWPDEVRQLDAVGRFEGGFCEMSPSDCRMSHR